MPPQTYQTLDLQLCILETAHWSIAYAVNNDLDLIHQSKSKINLCLE